jgi:hypothetical protein
MKRAFLCILAVAGFGCACAFGQGETGTVTVTQDFVFPPVGLASGETAAVSLVNIAPAPTTATATAPSCTGTVTFANAAGTIKPTPTAFTVGSGQIETISLQFANSGLTARGEIVASVQQTTTRSSTTPCSLLFSLEVFDSSGETHVFLGNASATTPPAKNGEQEHW